MQRHLGPLVFALCLTLAVWARAADAQTPGPILPTAPGAQKVNEGGTASAPASVPSAPGLSPLEPYLIAWLLPVSGIICVILGSAVDKRLRAAGG